MVGKKHSKANSDNELCTMRSASLTHDDVPTSMIVAPWGTVDSTNGSFVVDEESALLVLAAFDEHGTDLPIDYEHQTLGGAFSSPTGQAPAAGWIKRMSAKPNVGIVAEIEWTQQAKEQLAAKEYRYLSPVAMVRKGDRKLVAIHSAALTNKPAIVNMEPIVNRDRCAGELDSATEMEPMIALRSDLHLPEDAHPHEVLVAASRQLNDLRREATQRHIAHRVGEAMRAGKLVEAQRTWAEELVACEERLFDEWFRTAPVVVPLGRSVPPGGSGSTVNRNAQIACRARAEYRSNAALLALTSEEAFVADALRGAALN